MLNVALIPYYIQHCFEYMLKETCFFVKNNIGAVSENQSEHLAC